MTAEIRKKYFYIVVYFLLGALYFAVWYLTYIIMDDGKLAQITWASTLNALWKVYVISLAGMFIVFFPAYYPEHRVESMKLSGLKSLLTIFAILTLGNPILSLVEMILLVHEPLTPQKFFHTLSVLMLGGGVAMGIMVHYLKKWHILEEE